MPENRETIIALRARRTAFKVASDLTHKRPPDPPLATVAPPEPPLATVAPPEFFPFADDVLAACARYREGTATLGDVRIALWKWVHAIESVEPQSPIQSEVRDIIVHLENVELHVLAHPKLEKQFAISKAERKILALREKRIALTKGG